MQFYRCAIAALLLGTLWTPGASSQFQPASDIATVLAAADRPAARGPAPRTLGATEAVLDYCVANDPTGADKVRARLKQLVQGTSKQALAQMRQSGEYQSAHSAEAAFVGKVDPHNAHRICADAAAQGR